MAGLQLFPVTLLAALVSLFLTSEVGLIHTQREREGAYEVTQQEPGQSVGAPLAAH
jgi:hypothetical protein